MKTPSETIIQYQVQAEASVFDLWAQVYDIQPNPLLTLEERKVTPLLPSVSGHDISWMLAVVPAAGLLGWSYLSQLRSQALTAQRRCSAAPA